MNQNTTNIALPPLRILAIHRYFWPDTPPYASMLRAIACRWASEGHQVEVFSTQPSYKADAAIPRQPSVQQMDGFNVKRIDLRSEAGKPLIRLWNVLSFSLSILAHVARQPRFNVIMISTSPPVISGLVARLAAKISGARLVYHCMDIHPEIGRISGEFKHPTIFSFLRRIDISTCRSAARVVVLSQDMERAIRARPGAEASKISIINNFSIPTYDQESAVVSPEFAKQANMFRVIFAGNLGRFQGLESFIDAMTLLKDRSDIELVFMGGGRACKELVSRADAAQLNNIRFFPHQSVATAKAIISEADLCVVSLLPKIIQYAYPSKTMAYLEEGRPLLVSVELESALAATVQHENLGIAVTPGDVAGIADAIKKLADDRAAWAQMQINASERGVALFSEKSTLDLWSGLINELQQESINHV
ncbi:MAG: glycosyltransferase family 4 protein [Gallionella sp.]|nr:glycosyltransferase family 4 protein [Gallionella sp.]